MAALDRRGTARFDTSETNRGRKAKQFRDFVSQNRFHLSDSSTKDIGKKKDLDIGHGRFAWCGGEDEIRFKGATKAGSFANRLLTKSSHRRVKQGKNTRCLSLILVFLPHSSFEASDSKSYGSYLSSTRGRTIRKRWDVHRGTPILPLPLPDRWKRDFRELLHPLLLSVPGEIWARVSHALLKITRDCTSPREWVANPSPIIDWHAPWGSVDALLARVS